MTLDNLAMPEVGSLARIITCNIEGFLEPDDLRVLADPAVQVDATARRREVEDPTDLKKLRERHHSVARQLAAGVPPGVVATICGYTPSRISVLQNSPAMQELIGYYRMQQGAAAKVIGEKLLTTSLRAIDKLGERLEVEGEDAMKDDALISLAKLGLDRSGHGPTSKHHVTSETHVVDHARIAELNREALRGSVEYIVPIDEVRAAALPSPLAVEDAEFSETDDKEAPLA